MLRRVLCSRSLVSVAVLCFGRLLDAQVCPTAAAPPQEPTDTSLNANPGVEPLAPGAIYRDAMHPLDVVRGSLDNWSDAELGALATGRRRAKEACEQARPENYIGDDLYDLARLCSLAQDWNEANTAASRYLDLRAEPHRAQAYALSMNALVKMNGLDLAIETARHMLETLPYDAEVAFAMRFMKDYLEQAGNPESVKLAAQEHPAMVQALKAGGPLRATSGEAVMTRGGLYQSAMELSFLQRYGGDDAGAVTTVAEIEAALGAGGMPGREDEKVVWAVRAQYRLLGQHLPEVKPVRSLQSATAKPRIDSNGVTTVLVLFPDWCAQCERMMKTMTEFARVNKDPPIHAYGLMFQEDPDGTAPGPHDDFSKELLGTATLLVPPDTAQTFAAIDYPLGIVADGKEIIRFVGVLPSDAFDNNGYVSKVIQRMMAHGGAAMAAKRN